MIEVIKSISGYLVIGCVWIIWFERFCLNNKIGGSFSNKERYYQMIFWPINFGVFLFTWLNEVLKEMNNDRNGNN
tara:strand:- start:410 stop:634 length:225 start_codon:yes stop_codon:yes gene_type:complete